MLTYKLKEKTENTITYLFFPEGKGRAGSITFDKNGNVVEVSASPDDDIGWCTVHARCIDTSRDEGIVAWF